MHVQAWGVYGWAVRGTFAIKGTTLLTAAGMGYRCDFCNGTVLISDSSIQAAPGRMLSTTADGIHFMHHTGNIVLRDTLVSKTGDDCFNVHGNFFVMSEVSLGRVTATYIDETGPGWIPASPTFMVRRIFLAWA